MAKALILIGIVGTGLLAVQPMAAEQPELTSPDGQYSVEMRDNPKGQYENSTEKIILLLRGKEVIAKKIAGGSLQLIFWDEKGKYVAINNHAGSAGGDTWVYRLSDGKCIGSVISDSDMVKKATEAMKQLDKRITEKKLVKRIVEPTGWTNERGLTVDVYGRYQIRLSETDTETHGEEAMFVYHATLKVEGSKVVFVDGKADDEEHRNW